MDQQNAPLYLAGHSPSGPPPKGMSRSTLRKSYVKKSTTLAISMESPTKDNILPKI